LTGKRSTLDWCKHVQTIQAAGKLFNLLPAGAPVAPADLDVF
jgi:hypothetical protein